MKKYAIVIYFLISLITLFIALWGLMWIFSSASLASEHCKDFKLFHEEFRCRQPYIALIIFLFFIGISVLTFVAGFRKRRSLLK
jgi:hypothetical protein